MLNTVNIANFTCTLLGHAYNFQDCKSITCALKHDYSYHKQYVKQGKLTLSKRSMLRLQIPTLYRSPQSFHHPPLVSYRHPERNATYNRDLE